MREGFGLEQGRRGGSCLSVLIIGMIIKGESIIIIKFYDTRLLNDIVIEIQPIVISSISLASIFLFLAAFDTILPITGLLLSKYLSTIS